MMMVTALIILLVLPSIAHAGVIHYWYDNVYFVQGRDIDYAHPDNVYYDISPSSDWTKLGDDLYHHQINRDTTRDIVIGTIFFLDVLMLILFRNLGGTTTAYYVAGLAEIALTTFIDVLLDYYFVDERGCMWWWISRTFVYYLEKNMPYLSGIGKEEALSEILAAFLCFGYFRIGKVTFNNPQGLDDPPIEFTLSISATSGGTTDPAPGTHTYEYDTSQTVTASPNYYYHFDYWILDGATVYGSSITVTMDSNHTLTAYFAYSGGDGYGGCPTLFIWDGTDYADEGILNIHAESDITVQHEIQNTLALENDVYKLQLRELDNYTSHIDQVKLYAVDYQGKWNLCPLTYAYHSELGKVKQTLLFDDSNRVDLEPTETIDLKFSPSISYSQTAYFMFEINGYNRKWEGPG